MSAPEQRGLFDDPQGEERKAEGQERVLKNEHDEWKAAAHRLLVILVNSRDEVFSDDLRIAARAEGLEEPHHPNCWGALFGAAAKAGLIKRVGYRKASIPSCHARVVSVWKLKK